MASELRGIEDESDIQSLDDAARLLDVDVDADEDEIDTALTELSAKYHPDQDGTADLFTAIRSAADVLKEDVDVGVPPSAPPSQQRPPRRGSGVGGSGSSGGGSGTTDGPTAPNEDFRGGGFDESGSYTPGSTGTDRVDVEAVREAVEQVIKASMTEEEIQERFGHDVSMEEFIDILTELIAGGSISLGNLSDVVGPSSNVGSQTDPRFGGTDYRFGSGDNRFSRKDDRFGR